MIDNGIILMLVVFLTGTGIVAGFGIGLVVGLALGGREDGAQGRSTAETSPPLPAVVPVVEEPSAFTPGAQIAASAETGTASAQPRRAQSWSVALALAVIAVCCICTFLVAAIVTVVR